MFFFFAGPFIPALYTGAHLLAARKVPLFLRVSGVLLLLAISQIYPINITLFKNLSGPDMPAWLLKAQTALFAALVMLFLFLLARDVLSLAAFLGRVFFRKKAAAAPPESPSRRNFLRGGLAAAFSMGTPAVSLAGGAVGVSAGTAYPGLHFTDAFLPSLPPELEGLKIVQLTDIHIGPLTSADKIRDMAAKAVSVRPDLICITGDIADGLEGYRAENGGTRLEASRELAALRAPLGVWACTGNHEYYSDYSGWMSVYRSLGIRFLHNEAVTLTHKNTAFLLAGLDDPWAQALPARGHLPSPASFQIIREMKLSGWSWTTAPAAPTKTLPPVRLCSSPVTPTAGSASAWIPSWPARTKASSAAGTRLTV